MKQNIAEISQHDILWFVDNPRIIELDGASLEHIEALIGQGYSSGELHISYGKNDEKMTSGWWKMIDWRSIALELYNAIEENNKTEKTKTAQQKFNAAWQF